MCEIKETLTQREAYKLLLAHDIADEVERMEDRLEELKRKTISSPKMDGMPHGSSQGDAMVAMLVQKQQQEELLARTKEKLERAIKAAQKVIKDLPPSKRLFYEAYYLMNEKQLTACAIARISESTGYRYMRAIVDAQ